MPIFSTDLPIAVGCDHAGFEYKTKIVPWLNQQGWQVNDFGTYDTSSVDYPDYVHPVALSVEKQESAFGILICGTGNGVCMTANKHAGIRAGLCWATDVAKLIRQHNNANIICLPARFVALASAQDMITAFMSTAFEGGRHQNRINKMAC